MNEIVKVCKKHGSIEEKDTYLRKNYKNGNLMRLCLICKKGYKNNWAKLNPQKIIESQVKKRNKRIKQLEDGILKKTCINHGLLSIDRIRIDSRGTLVCRICVNENKKKYFEKDPVKIRERTRKWYHSDVERKKRYAEKDKPKRRIRQIKNYYKIKMEDRERYKKIEKTKLACAKKARDRLDDSYVKSLLRTIRYGGGKNRFYRYLVGAEFPKEFLNEIKEMIKIKRKIKKLRNNLQCQK